MWQTLKMQENDQDQAKPLFVKDMTDEQIRTGLADLRNSALSVTLFAFDASIAIDEDKPAIFMTERGEIMTLHNFFANGGGFRSGTGGSVYNDTLNANQIVIGPDVWEPDDGLKRCTFRVPHVADLLHNMDRFRAIEQANFGALPNFDVFTLDVAGAKISLTHDVRSNGYYSRPTEIEPKFVIEFDMPRSIEKARNLVNKVVSFLSAALARKLTVNEIRISRNNTDEVNSAFKKNRKIIHDHTVKFYDPDKKTVVESQIGAARSFVHVRNDADVDLFKQCLQQWLERGEEWGTPTALMLNSFELNREITANRLLAATRWIERIPGVDGATSIKEDHLNEIIEAAIGKATALGYSDLEVRMRGALAAIKTENNRERLSRLAKKAGDAATVEFNYQGLAKAGMKVRDFRGKAAHGSIFLKDEEEQADFEVAIFATECLAYLLMLVDLPLNAEAKKRLQRATPVRTFSHYWSQYTA